MARRDRVWCVADGRTACARPSLEPLEPRRLFSAAVSVARDVLVIKGTRLADNIELAMDGEKGLLVTVNGVTSKVAKRRFSTIRIVAGRGNDRVYANDLAWTHPMKRPMVLHLGAGNDNADTNFSSCTVWGEDGNDTIISHDGRDVIRGGTGDDSIEGRYGNDTLWGESGNDYIRGGGDNDYVSGGRGNDTLKDGWGKDTVWGNNGTDEFLYSDQTGDTWADRATGEKLDVDWVYDSVGGSVGIINYDGVLVRTSISGDFTLDGSVDFDDLAKLAQNYNTVNPQPQN